MPTAAQYSDVRYPLAADSTTLPDAELDPLFVKAALRYAGNDGAQSAWVGVQVVRNLRAQAAKRTDYKQNQSQEWLSQIYPRLKELQADFEEELEIALTSYQAPVRFGSLRRIAPPVVDVPGGLAVMSDSAEVNLDSDVSRRIGF